MDTNASSSVSSKTRRLELLAERLEMLAVGARGCSCMQPGGLKQQHQQLKPSNSLVS